jgi:hypothetical protein
LSVIAALRAENTAMREVCEEMLFQRECFKVRDWLISMGNAVAAEEALVSAFLAMGRRNTALAKWQEVAK